MRLDTVWRPFLLLGGATPENSYAEIAEDELRLRFGLLFSQRVSISNVKSAKTRSWPFWGGIGWRFWGEQLGLLGSTRNVVEISLRERIRVSLGILPWPFSIGRVAISLEDPQAFIDDVLASQAVGSEG
jgi:hypothetical protein